jgi:hypothetical protein
MIGLVGAAGVAVGGVVVSLVAIPIAAALLPLAREVVFLRLDRT